MNYQEIITDYIQNHLPIVAAEERFFRDELNSFEEALLFAGLAIGSKGRRLMHANRFQYHALGQALEAMTLERERIKSQTTFHDILHTISNVLLSARIRNLSEMYWYDTSLRIASHLKNREPEHIYLHAGARKGASALGIKIVEDNGDWRKYIDVPELRELSEIDSSLKPRDYEHILCINKNKFPISQ